MTAPASRVRRASVQKGFSAMNFRILAAPALAARAGFRLAGGDCTVRHVAGFRACARLQRPAPRRAEGRSEGRSQGRSEGGAGSGGSASAAAAARRRRPAGRPAGAADLCALDQVLPEGSGRQRQAGLLHRQGRPHRIRPAGHRRRHHRAGRRAEEDPARDAAARHAARSRHPHHHRQQRAGAEPLRDLLPQRLHVGLRSDAGTARPT